MKENVVPTEQVAVEPEVPVVEETPSEPVEPEEAAEEVVDEPPPPPPKKKSVQDRIDEITRKMREKEREAEHWREVALAKKEREELNSPPPPATVADPRPSIDQFDTTEAYDDAVYEWRKKQESRKAEQDKRAEEEKTLWRKFDEKAKKIREERDDFDEVIKAPVFTDAMKYVLLQSDNGPELAYYLATPENRDTAERIMSLTPERQTYEIGKLETKLALAKTTKKVPGAPPPITPVGMVSGGKEKDPSEMTIEEWMKWDKAQEIERYNKRRSGG